MLRRCALLLCALFVAAQPLRAQFFNFGFGNDPFMQRRQQVQQETVTPPEYKGGEDALKSFLLKHFRNPEPRQRQAEGRIIVACLIGEKGKVEKVQVQRGLTPELNAEAERVCKKLKFKPAKRGKKRVKSRYQVAIPIHSGRISYTKLSTVEI